MHILNKLRKHPSKYPLVVLAPMAGVSDLPFRELCENQGADYSVSEMVSSLPQLMDSKKNKYRINFVPNTHIKVVQIIGNNPMQMAEAAKFYTQMGAEIIDINMGCPMKKISKKGAGAALLEDLNLVENILKEVVASVNIPVTLKTRLGLNKQIKNIEQVAQIAQNSGISMLTIHGRTKADRFSGNAEYDLIAKVKQQINIPVIVNGDIDSANKAKKILEFTKCDGIMIGRGSIGKPWLFSQTKRLLNNTNDNKLSNLDMVSIILKHVNKIHLFYGENGFVYARKHLKQYFKELGLNKECFEKISTISNNEQQYDELNNILNI